MSKWSKLRENIDDAVRTYYRVDDWYLDQPDPEIQSYPPNRGALYPASDIRLVRGQLGCEASVTLTYEVKYWFSEMLEYHQLPLFQLEAILIGGLGHLVGGGISGLDGIRIEGSSPGLMIERSDNNQPWLCIVPFNLRLIGAFDSEDVPALQPLSPTDPPFEIQEINLYATADSVILQ